MTTRLYTYDIVYNHAVRPHRVSYAYNRHNLYGSLNIEGVTYMGVDVLHLVDDALYIKIWDAAIDDVVGYLHYENLPFSMGNN